MLVLAKESIIYICCPAKYASGGPEALHQLYFYLNKKGFNVRMVYHGVKKEIKDQINDRYKKYCLDYIFEDEIQDNIKNVIIVPESYTEILKKYKNIKKCIWWLSVIFYDMGKVSLKDFCVSMYKLLIKFSSSRIKNFFSRLNFKKNFDNVKNVAVNFVGSKYAFEFLYKKGVKNIEYLVEPISKEFLVAGKFNELMDRSNVVLYNPAKKSKIIKKLLKNSNIVFQPIKGFTPTQLIELYRKSKLYIDFGEFGGPERIPKEAVYNGCVILVANHNAASNDFDVAIKREYKIDKFNSYKNVVSRINYMLENYANIVHDFAVFQNKIDLLEYNFIKQIDACFIKQ